MASRAPGDPVCLTQQTVAASRPAAEVASNLSLVDNFHGQGCCVRRRSIQCLQRVWSCQFPKAALCHSPWVRPPPPTAPLPTEGMEMCGPKPTCWGCTFCRRKVCGFNRSSRAIVRYGATGSDHPDAAHRAGVDLQIPGACMRSLLSKRFRLSPRRQCGLLRPVLTHAGASQAAGALQQ